MPMVTGDDDGDFNLIMAIIDNPDYKGFTNVTKKVRYRFKTKSMKFLTDETIEYARRIAGFIAETKCPAHLNYDNLDFAFYLRKQVESIIFPNITDEKLLSQLRKINIFLTNVYIGLFCAINSADSDTLTSLRDMIEQYLTDNYNNKKTIL